MPNGEYQSEAPTATADRTCDALTVCGNTQASLHNPPTDGTATTDDICCYAYLDDLTITDGAGWPTGYTEDCLIVVGNLSIEGDAPADDTPTKLAGITGNLKVDGYNGTSLTFLGHLQRVDGGIIISQSALLNLNGLENISQLGASTDMAPLPISLGLVSLPNLQNIHGLQGLERLEGSVYLAALPALYNLDGLHHITDIGGTLLITQTGAENLLGLRNLRSLGQMTGAGGISYSMMLMQNTRMTDLRGLEQITSVSGGIAISENPVLSSLSGLDNLTSIGGGLTLMDLPTLTTIKALSKLESLGIGSPDLSDASLLLGDSPQLESLRGLEALTKVPGSIALGGNDGLTDLTGLGNLERIGGEFYIRDNAQLSSLDGLESLNTVQGDLSIGDNPLLCADLADALATQTSPAATDFYDNDGICL